MGEFSYFCVSCGEEIKPEQAGDKMMVSLSYAALDGAPDTVIEKTPVYVTRRELESLINRKDPRGRQFLTLEEYLTYAYRGKSESRAVVEKVLKTMYGLAEDADEPQTDEEGEQRYSSFEEKEPDRIPGFGETAVNQIKENFPNGVCYLTWSVNETKGYLYKLTYKVDAIQRITPFWVCSSCKEEILADAFEYRQILVGLLGFASAGKTCLIASLCRLLIDQGGILMATKSIQSDYKELLLDYEGGYALDKTGFEGANTYHPSVLKNDVMWTFVDIPGETFFKEDKQDLDDKILVSNPKIQMSLKCHAYILTADYRIIQNSMLRSDALKTFQSFINFAEAFSSSSKKGAPLLFALTKVDEVEKGADRSNVPEYCIQNSFQQAYRKELSIIRNKGLNSFVDELAKRNYLLALTCAPYGFSPLACDNPAQNIFTQRDNKDAWKREYMQNNPGVDEKMIPHPVYQKARPRNADMIMAWLEKLFGVREIVYDSINGLSRKQDISTISRFEGHWDDELVSMIASMFCNPNALDAQWYMTLGDSSFFKNFKQKRIVKKYEKGLARGKASLYDDD